MLDDPFPCLRVTLLRVSIPFEMIKEVVWLALREILPVPYLLHHMEQGDGRKPYNGQTSVGHIKAVVITPVVVNECGSPYRQRFILVCFQMKHLACILCLKH